MNDYKAIANPIELTPLVLKSLGEYIGTNCPGVGMQTETDKLRGDWVRKHFVLYVMNVWFVSKRKHNFAMTLIALPGWKSRILY